MSAASVLFPIVYNAVYYFLYLVLFAFLVVTPVDLIQKAVERHRNYDILAIALCYLVTILVVGFIYAARLYINRSALASIPKSWIPIEKGDVPRGVRQMIVGGLGRSAAIAYEARPRVLPAAEPIQMPPTDAAGEHSKTSTASGEGVVLDMPEHKPVWGEIEHPGWAPPTCPDLPNLQYDTVVLELPNLIEAKALTLAPPDPESHADPPALDPDAVALLQRPESMGLREYLMHLTKLAVLAPLPATSEFLTQYEAARFSARPLSNEQFRSLMRLFADILRNTHPLARYEDDSSSGHAPSESDIDNDAPRWTSPSSAGTAQDVQAPSDNAHSGTSHRPSPSTAGSGRLRPGSSANMWHGQYRTAPTTPKSRRTGPSRASSSEGFAQMRRSFPASQTSSASLRSVGGGSVIRLAGSEDATDLPYVLTPWPS